MDDLPVEILQQIFELSCSDRRTGCALSEVSRHIREISSPYRLRTVFLTDPSAIIKFAAHIQAIPSRLIRTKHLFLSDSDPRRPWTRWTPNPEDTSESTDGLTVEETRASMENWRQRFVEGFAILDRTITSILITLSPNLLSLSLSTATMDRLQCAFPVLESLAIGTLRWTDVSPPKCLPTLKRLHIFRSTSTGVMMSPEIFAAMCPNMTHLRFSAVGAFPDFPICLAALLGRPWPDFDVSSPHAGHVALLQNLKVLLVQPIIGNRIVYKNPGRLEPIVPLASIMRLAAYDPQKRLVLLEGGSVGGYEWPQQVKDWQDWVEGGEGCWQWDEWRDAEGKWKEEWTA